MPSASADGTAIIAGAGTLSNIGTIGAPTAVAAACGVGGPMPANVMKICSGATSAAFTATADSVVIATGAQCAGTNQTAAGSARQMAVLYASEPGSGAAWPVACLNI